METTAAGKQSVSPGKFALKWGIVALIVLVNLYADACMYLNGDIVYPLLDIIIVGLGVWVFTSKKMYAQRYAFPSVAGMIAFIIFPLVYTVYISFTNYSGDHIMTVDDAEKYHLNAVYRSEGGDYDLKMLAAGGKYQLMVTQGDKTYVTDPVKLESGVISPEAKRVDVSLREPTDAEKAAEGVQLKELISHRLALQKLNLHVPDSNIILAMSGLRRFSAESPKFTPVKVGTKLDDGTVVGIEHSLFDNETKKLFVPNMETGFYQYAGSDGQPEGKTFAPGFRVNIGFMNYIKFFGNKSVRAPFAQIFIWTVAFAGLTVIITLAIGMVLACLVQWEFLAGRSVYRVLLILPYAVPSFISILVFKGLFNQNFGEINMFLGMIFGPIYNLFGWTWTAPEWFTNPWLARGMILIVNAWLGYPYMMILCMGLLKSIPDDLYEATALEGASPLQNLRYITLPLLMKPLAPLLIASFAFNFNNFVLIQLLTKGGPDIIDSTVPAGYTDLLVSFTYRIAFEGGKGNDYGLAAAIATLIFILVGFLSLIQLRLIRQNNDGRV
jgi:maltose/maltodextrin transport system permease protein